MWGSSISTCGQMNPAQWSWHTCIAWDWIWKLHIKMMAALHSGHLGAGSWESWRQQRGIGGTACTLHSDGQSYAAQQYKRELKTEAPQTLHLTLLQKVFGLLQMSPDAPCQIKKEAQSPCIKYPLHKEVEPGTSLLQRHGAPLPPLVVDDKGGYERK